MRVIYKIPIIQNQVFLFADISTLIFDKNAFSSTIDKLIDIAKNYEFDLVVSIDARGVLFGSVIAHQLNKGLIMVRKK